MMRFLTVNISFKSNRVLQKEFSWNALLVDNLILKFHFTQNGIQSLICMRWIFYCSSKRIKIWQGKFQVWGVVEVPISRNYQSKRLEFNNCSIMMEWMQVALDICFFPFYTKFQWFIFEVECILLTLEKGRFSCICLFYLKHEKMCHFQLLSLKIIQFITIFWIKTW